MMEKLVTKMIPIKIAMKMQKSKKFKTKMHFLNMYKNVLFFEFKYYSKVIDILYILIIYIYENCDYYN